MCLAFRQTTFLLTWIVTQTSFAHDDTVSGIRVKNYEYTGIPPSARCATSPRGQNTSRFCKRSAAKPSRYPPERSAWRIREYTNRKIIKTEFLSPRVFIDFYYCVSRGRLRHSFGKHSAAKSLRFPRRHEVSRESLRLHNSFL